MTCLMSLGVTRESTRVVHVDVFELQAVSFIIDMQASGIKKFFFQCIKVPCYLHMVKYWK